jgi:mannan endo-1,4-beta-mannosidase
MGDRIGSTRSGCPAMCPSSLAPKAGARRLARGARADASRSASWRLVYSILVGALLLIFGSDVPVKAKSFVTTRGAQFMLNARPFYVTGVNNHYVVWGSKVEVDRVLDAAVAMGANVVRTILGPAIGAPGGRSPQTIWDFKSNSNSYELNTHGVYLLYWDPKAKSMAINEGADGIGRIDDLLAAASKRHLKLLLALVDNWAFIGDMPQMDAWYGSTDKTGFFFTDPKTIADYKTWARYLITHVNPLTGRMYRDDPTIFGWELMNESQARPDLRHSWTATMSAYIKALDPNHLVSSGDALLTMDDFSTPSIDFVTWHAYPKYYGITPDAMNALIRSNCEVAGQYQKPVLLEEFGYAGNSKEPTQAEVYHTWLKTMATDKNCAGWLVWSLVAQQDSGFYPKDTGGWFDIHEDGGSTWTLLSGAAHAGRAYAGQHAHLKRP